MKQHTQEVKLGQRFEFGKNWSRFLRLLDEKRITEAEQSLKAMLEVKSLEGKSFLDAGSGSGLFSLAARRLGAKVHSFDYDPTSVACTMEIKRRYFSDDTQWMIGEGSVLDREYLNTLGMFDFVYSWGVLHHTGAMWQALENVANLVNKNGLLYIAIYNDQREISQFWLAIKHQYNRSTWLGRYFLTYAFLSFFEIRYAFFKIIKLQNPFSLSHWKDYKSARGMSRWTDLIDWLGGYPFEVAKPETIFDFYYQRGFQLKKMTTCGGRQGCNEFVFVRTT